MGTTMAPGRRGKHAAARSRLVAGVLSATLFAGLGSGMAARAAAAHDGGSAATGDSSATNGSPAASDDSGSASRSWSAAPSPGQDQSAATTSAGS